jgi:RNA polymerase sigma-70 factor, ECF subfamily
MTSGIPFPALEAAEAAQHIEGGRVQDVMASAVLDLDAALMLRVREGDPESFSALLDRHRTPVTRLLFRLVQNHAIAEELSQEVFLRVFRTRERYEPSAKFKTWLFRIATNLALNCLRDGRNARLQESLSGTPLEGAPKQFSDSKPTVESSLVEQVKVNAVREAIAALPEKQRAAVLMHKYEEMDYSQIARALNCSESAVKSLLFRAYETLRERLAQYA